MLAKVRDESDTAFDAYFSWLTNRDMNTISVGGGGGGWGGYVIGADQDYVGTVLYESNVKFYGYSYNGPANTYYSNYTGQVASWDEVYNNYVVPNSKYSFSGEVAQDLISAFIQVSPSMNYTASIDGASVDPFFKSLKLLLPVAFIMEGDLSWEAGLATSMTPGGMGIVLRGINAGTVFFYSAGGVGGGWFGAAGSINTAYFFYSGNVNKFNQYSLEGKSTVIACSAGEGASFGRSIILMKDNYGQTIIGIGTSIGAGGSPTIGSGQITIQNTHIWR